MFPLADIYNYYSSLINTQNLTTYLTLGLGGVTILILIIVMLSRVESDACFVITICLTTICGLGALGTLIGSYKVNNQIQDLAEPVLQQSVTKKTIKSTNYQLKTHNDKTICYVNGQAYKFDNNHITTIDKSKHSKPKIVIKTVKFKSLPYEQQQLVDNALKDYPGTKQDYINNHTSLTIYK